MKDKHSNIIRRDFLKGLVAVPFLGYFVFGFKENIDKEVSEKLKDYQGQLGIGEFDSPREKLLPPSGTNGKRLKIGLIGNGWRGEQLLHPLGYAHPETIKANTINGELNSNFLIYAPFEDLNVEFAGVCDTFDIHAKRGAEFIPIPMPWNKEGDVTKPPKIFATYREMIASNDIDAVVICTPDHTHVPIAIAAAKAGKHVYLEKPMSHSIEESIEIRDTIQSTGVVFQLGHENRQQMSYKMGREMYQKGVLGTVSMVQAFTNRNSENGAWIRKRKYDHLGNPDNINWKEFLGNAPWSEFDAKKYFNWQRYSDYGTGVIGNDFSHSYDCINQILGLGIPEEVVALGGQYYYKDHGDMPDVMNVIFSYPERGLTMTYDCSLKNGIYCPPRILGSEAAMEINRSILLYKDSQSKRYKDVKVDSTKPFYYYEPNTDVDAITAATAKVYIQSGYGPTFIDGKVIDATFLHLKEWIDAIRGHGETSGNVVTGFEESVTFNLANLAYKHKKPVRWDKVNEKAIIG